MASLLNMTSKWIALQPIHPERIDLRIAGRHFAAQSDRDQSADSPPPDSESGDRNEVLNRMDDAG